MLQKHDGLAALVWDCLWLLEDYCCWGMLCCKRCAVMCTALSCCAAHQNLRAMASKNFYRQGGKVKVPGENLRKLLELKRGFSFTHLTKAFALETRLSRTEP